jgi:hypothetical protein
VASRKTPQSKWPVWQTAGLGSQAPQCKCLLCRRDLTGLVRRATSSLRSTSKDTSMSFSLGFFSFFPLEQPSNGQAHSHTSCAHWGRGRLRKRPA